MERNWQKNLDTTRKVIVRGLSTLAWNGIVWMRALKNVMPADVSESTDTMLQPLNDRRRNRRIAVDREITVQIDGQSMEAVRVINISTGGMYLELDHPLAEGQQLKVNLYGKKAGDFPSATAQVLRCTDKGMAIKFR